MKAEAIDLPDASLVFIPHFLPKNLADDYFAKLLDQIPWKQEKIKLFGKEHLQPRLSAFFGTEDLSYSYSGITLEVEHFSPELLSIKNRVEEISKTDFNSCLANLYRDGNDSMGWHSDDEKELGKNPVIASVSFGAERIFHLKHKQDPAQKQKIMLPHGSLLIMKEKTQHFWKHQLPKTRKIKEPRLNLTFRNILPKRTYS